jgi:excisionase family DNA binding protein
MKRIDYSALLTPKQAAERLGVSVDTIQQYAREPQAKLKAVRFLGRLLFEPREIARYARGSAGVGRKRVAAKRDGKTS